jgi:hypothetical protein
MDGEVAYTPIGINQFCFHCHDLKSITFDLSTLLAYRSLGQGRMDFENLWRCLEEELQINFFGCVDDVYGSQKVQKWRSKNNFALTSEDIQVDKISEPSTAMTGSDRVSVREGSR